MKYLVFTISLIFLSSCWTDHFNMEYRLRDEDLLELEKKQTFLSQYEFLLEKKAFSRSDFYSPTFKALSQEQRIDLYIELNKKLSKKDISLLKNKMYYKGVSQEWIVVIFGPPPLRRQITAGFESIYYVRKVFHFHQKELVGWGDS